MGLEVCYVNLEAISDIFQNLIETQWVMWLFVNEIKKTSRLLIESVLIYTTKSSNHIFTVSCCLQLSHTIFYFTLKKKAAQKSKKPFSKPSANMTWEPWTRIWRQTVMQIHYESHNLWLICTHPSIILF